MRYLPKNKEEQGLQVTKKRKECPQKKAEFYLPSSVARTALAPLLYNFFGTAQSTAMGLLSNICPLNFWMAWKRRIKNCKIYQSKTHKASISLWIQTIHFRHPFCMWIWQMQNLSTICKQKTWYDEKTMIFHQHMRTNLENERIYPVWGLHGIKASQTNPAGEKTCFIWSTLAYIDVKRIGLETESPSNTGKKKKNEMDDSIRSNLERKISNNKLPFLSLGTLANKHTSS